MPQDLTGVRVLWDSRQLREDQPSNMASTPAAWSDSPRKRRDPVARMTSDPDKGALQYAVHREHFLHFRIQPAIRTAGVELLAG